MQSGLSKEYIRGWERFHHWLHNNYGDEATRLQPNGTVKKTKEGKKDEQSKQK